MTIHRSTSILFLLAFACESVDKPDPAPVGGTGDRVTWGDEIDEPTTSTGDTEPERDPIYADDVDAFEFEIDPMGAMYDPGADGYISESHDKCCLTGTYTGCVDDVSNGCGAGRSRTVCYGCDVEDGCSESFVTGQWTWTGQNWFCNGLSFYASTSVMVHDHCSFDGGAPGGAPPEGTCVPYGDAGVATTDVFGGHGCPGEGAVAVWTFDGAIGRMCCRDDANAPSGTQYSCVPVSSTTGSCGTFDPHTTNAYCMPCSNGPMWDDPDGTGTNNTEGGWDLRGITAGTEPQGSVYCEAGEGDTIPESGLPDWTLDRYQKLEYVCRGDLVHATSGNILHSECG